MEKRSLNWLELRILNEHSALGWCIICSLCRTRQWHNSPIWMSKRLKLKRYERASDNKSSRFWQSYQGYFSWSETKSHVFNCKMREFDRNRLKWYRNRRWQANFKIEVMRKFISHDLWPWKKRTVYSWSSWKNFRFELFNSYVYLTTLTLNRGPARSWWPSNSLAARLCRSSCQGQSYD